LRIVDCGLNNNEPAVGHAAVAVNPQFAIRNPQFPCSLLAGVRIERGGRDDWLALAPLHYRSHHAGAVTDIFKTVWDRGISAHCGLRIANCELNGNEPAAGHAAVAVNPQSAIRNPQSTVLVAVIVYSRSPLSLAARDRATGGRYRTGGFGRVATADLINRELRIISRVVVAPNWRGLGLASRLVAETLGQVGTPYIEALAAMGEMHPMFVRAGMTAYPQPPSKEGERLRAALEAAGLARADRRSADRLAAAIDALSPAARALADREIARWARSYLGAKNHRTNRPDRRRMLDLVARHLDAAPVYYLWRSP
jgi:GNAT superfamily N-acetyltransferase